MNIHPTAIIDKKARIGDGTTVGPYARIEGDVVIGKDCDIKQAAQILDGTRIGDRCEIFQGALISAIPQDKKFSGEQSFLEIGDDSIIREYATIARSTKPGGKTIVGKKAYIMTSAHIGHDCQVGNDVTMANLVTLAGHVKVGNNVNIGGFTVIHQFVRIGDLAMIGGDSGLMMDAPPYMITFGYPPAKVYGVNMIGLRRNDINLETRMLLKRAFKLLFRSNLNFSQAIEKINSEITNTQEIANLVDFMKETKRGIAAGNHPGHLQDSQQVNGTRKMNFHALMNIVKDEETALDIIALLDSKTEDADSIDKS